MQGRLTSRVASRWGWDLLHPSHPSPSPFHPIPSLSHRMAHGRLEGRVGACTEEGGVVGLFCGPGLVRPVRLPCRRPLGLPLPGWMLSRNSTEGFAFPSPAATGQSLGLAFDGARLIAGFPLPSPCPTLDLLLCLRKLGIRLPVESVCKSPLPVIYGPGMG